MLTRGFVSSAGDPESHGRGGFRWTQHVRDHGQDHLPGPIRHAQRLRSRTGAALLRGAPARFGGTWVARGPEIDPRGRTRALALEASSQMVPEDGGIGIDLATTERPARAAETEVAFVWLAPHRHMQSGPRPVPSAMRTKTGNASFSEPCCGQ